MLDRQKQRARGRRAARALRAESLRLSLPLLIVILPNNRRLTTISNRRRRKSQLALVVVLVLFAFGVFLLINFDSYVATSTSHPGASSSQGCSYLAHAYESVNV